MEQKHIAITLADIGGYTRFVRAHRCSAVHAEEIISELLEAVVERAAYPLQLNKLEGDAALMFAPIPEGDRAAAQEIVRQVRAFFEGFRAKQQALVSAAEGGCPCHACRHIQDLSLKAILHSGLSVIKRFRQFEELAGESVILAHRLLKNSVSQREYLLMTEAFHEAGGRLADLPPEPRVEKCEGLGDVRVVVYYPSFPPLSVPQTRPMTRWSGTVEGGRLMTRGLWRRLAGKTPATGNSTFEETG